MSFKIARRDRTIGAQAVRHSSPPPPCPATSARSSTPSARPADLRTGDALLRVCSCCGPEMYLSCTSLVPAVGVPGQSPADLSLDCPAYAELGQRVVRGAGQTRAGTLLTAAITGDQTGHWDRPKPTLPADYGRLTTMPSCEDDAHRSADSGRLLSSNAFDRPSVGGRPDNGPLSLPGGVRCPSKTFRTVSRSCP